MTFNAYNGNGDPLTYKENEHFVKKASIHRNISNQGKTFVERSWKETLINSEKNW